MAAALLTGAMSFAQDCPAVATINEDFSDFTAGTGWAGENCWNKIALGFAGGGGMVYADATTEPANIYINYYSAGAVGAFSYLIGPEISTFNGEHELSFSAWKTGQNGSIPAGTVTIQVGTMTSLTDATTFVALEGASFTLTSAVGDTTDEVETFNNIVIPSAPAGSHIAFRLSSDTAHNALAIDDVVWSEVETTEPECEAVATLDENFNDFTVASPPSALVAQNCWTSSVGGGLIYMSGADGDNYVTFYTAGVAGNSGFLVTPELTAINTTYALKFDAGTVTPTSEVSLQLGTLSALNDFENFEEVGEPIALTFNAGAGDTYENITFPAVDGQKYIAFKFTGTGDHHAAFIDNVTWTTTSSSVDFNKSAFSIYPNPATGKNVTVAYNNDNAELVSIFNLAGAKVFEAKANGTSQNLDLNGLSSGMYIVKVQSGNASTTQKLILQ
ncbi:Por secretion system C-terminal sorting domain-containing protein [Flavobacterium akiainvivens]|nr:Por secretion system C-terminal sorting domain-containing protein [Flavobacterium akiainvivens]